MATAVRAKVFKAKDNTNQHGTTALKPKSSESCVPLQCITKECEFQSYLTDTNNIFADSIKTVVGLHFEFAAKNDNTKHPEVVAIAISSDEAAVVFVLASLPKAQVITGLQALLSNPMVTKVMHSVHQVAYLLHCYGLQIPCLTNCVDLQLLYEIAIDSTVLDATVIQIATACSREIVTGLAQSTLSFSARSKLMKFAMGAIKMLSEKLQRSMAQTAKLYASCYIKLQCKSSLKKKCAVITSTRWEVSVINQGNHAIWFDPDADNQPRSLEFLYSGTDGNSATKVPSLTLQCELDSLLDLLPSSYRDAICKVDNYALRLVDICIDVGRIPFAYIGRRQRIPLGLDGKVVLKETIDNIIEKLGGEMRIGGDNRVGIERQLHRISVMRSKSDEVYGLTMRVGRALCNAACVLTDLLLSGKHANKSVLILGHPGSGKTTLIRDVARCVSKTMENVCIIDTSNEIGGDGLVPHECVGWARRMMVPSLEAQARVMVECVQNHTVETLIVDEIGRKAEVLAASTVRQRGPRLIASAHGDFRALLRNPDLKGLVGGSQQVTLGDKEAKESSKGKLQTQRAGNPIFDVIVELDHVARGRCRIIWDVAKAVDTVLEGKVYPVETRRWDRSTRGVQVLKNSHEIAI
ncbi:hypothetical protein CCR75_003681 [Bremia lactucae]|uniref:AAA+ ATPase domain-containing protein n=1 Tax=Bremia lactucae TaxID=4779 RepID=A0A976IJ13_BRELC|nr:hypothetical protein CCR75_003681 [Bremia lactucae]